MVVIAHESEPKELHSKTLNSSILVMVAARIGFEYSRPVQRRPTTLQAESELGEA